MKVLDIALKDLLRSCRSLFALGMSLVIPLAVTGLIYFAFGSLSQGTGKYDFPDLNVVVANQDRPGDSTVHLGERLVTYLQDERMPSWLHVSTVADEAVAREAVQNQQAGVAVLVPDNFTKSLFSDEAATVTLLQDPILTVGPTIVKDLLAQFVDGISGSKIAFKVIGAQGETLTPTAQQQVAQQYADWFTTLQQNLHHSEDSLLDLQAPAGAGADSENGMARVIANIMCGMMIFFAFYTGAYAAQSILREEEEGTLPRLFTTSTSRTSILAGKFLGVAITVAAQVTVLLVASHFIFQITWGQPLSILLASAGLVAAATGFGILLISFTRDLRQSGPVIGGVVSATGMLGGLFSTGVANMPAALEKASYAMPQGWAMQSWKLSLSGAGAGELALPVLAMVAMGALFFFAGARVFNKRFA
jgi:ABC-2 type transport system permease protein